MTIYGTGVSPIFVVPYLPPILTITKELGCGSDLQLSEFTFSLKMTF